MQYRLGIDGAPETVAAGTSVLLVHPSTAETDRIDTDFLGDDTDEYLVVSTRTTAREVEQKLEFYDVAKKDATILDAISIERGYSRRQSDRFAYLPSPDDVDGLVDTVEGFLTDHDGKLKVSFDSITEMAYYAGDAPTQAGVEELVSLIDEHGAVGLFHLAAGVHDTSVIDAYKHRFDLVLSLDDNGELSVSD